MADRDRARRPRRPRRDRPAPPTHASAVELNVQTVELQEPSRPRPSWAWSEAVPLAAAPEAAANDNPAPLRRAEARGAQTVHSNGTPSWAWEGTITAPPIAVVFADSLVAPDRPVAPAKAPAAPRRAAPRRGTAERLLLLAIPAAIALGVVILLSRALPEPSGGGGEALWWSILAASGLATLVVGDVIARRLRPAALAGAGLPRLGGGLGEMAVVVAIAAVLGGAGILHLPSGVSSTATASHASAPVAIAPTTASPPLAVTQAPAAVPPLPAQRAPITGGGGVDLPVLALDPGMVSHPAVVRTGGRVLLPLPPPLRASRGGATADATALSGGLTAPDAAPVDLGPVSPASAATSPRHPQASSDSGAGSCGGDGAACPADQVHSLSSESSSAFASVERGPAPDCSPAAGSEAAPPTASACTSGIHLEMLLSDAGRSVVADAVDSSSFVSGCRTAPMGQASIGDLEIGGVQVAGGPGALVPTSTPDPNTSVSLAIGTVVLNEQRPDRGGHGLTVNAVHIVAPASMLSPFSLDMVIGHTHSAARPGGGCAAARVPAVVAPQSPSADAGPGMPEAVLPDVLQLRRVVRGLISL